MIRVCFAVLLGSLPLALAAQDVIVLKTGENIACQIDDLTDKIVNFTLSTGSGNAVGSARRTIQTDQIERIEFGFEAGEETAFARRGEAPASLLKTWWDYHFPHLHRPRSRSAAFGVAYGNALLREDPGNSPARALPLFDHIIARAWSPDDVAAAKQGRLRALMAKGDLATATAEARVLARETEDPALLIEVEHLLATADFAALRTLEEEHPRWIEDDEVRPKRNELFHRALDGFLKPHLFHATREEAAARGLFSAAELYHFAKENDEARARWEDLVKLYPSTTHAAESTKRLETLFQNPPTAPTAVP